METYADFKQKYTSESLTHAYALSRPLYSKAVLQQILKFCQETSGKFEFALDVGCGPGISTLPLKEYFEQVMGIDVSAAQIANAPQNVSGVSFLVADCEDLSFLPSNSVDLVNAASSVHWLNLNRFYPEVDRVLRPGGSFVAYGYTSKTIQVDNERIQNYMRQVYQQLKPYWPEQVIQLTEDGYQSLPAMYDGWHREIKFSKPMDWSIKHLVGLMASSVSLEKFDRENPESDFRKNMQNRLVQICSEEGLDTDTVFHVSFPISMVMAHKPQV